MYHNARGFLDLRAAIQEVLPRETSFMLHEIRTERLLLGRMGPADYGAFMQMHQDSRVMAMLGGVRGMELLT